MSVRFNAAFDLGQLRISEQFSPATQVECSLRLVLRKFDGQCRHVVKLPPLRWSRQARWVRDRPCLLRFPNDFPIHNRHCGLHRVQLGRVHLENVAVQNHHVGQFAGREAALHVFLKLAER